MLRQIVWCLTLSEDSFDDFLSSASTLNIGYRERSSHRVTRGSRSPCIRAREKKRSHRVANSHVPCFALSIWNFFERARARACDFLWLPLLVLRVYSIRCRDQAAAIGSTFFRFYSFNNLPQTLPHLSWCYAGLARWFRVNFSPCFRSLVA